MSAIVPIAELRDYEAMDLERVLCALARFGEPTMMKMDRGWWCFMKVHVSAVGAVLKVESESNAKSPTVAARQCAERLVATIKQFGGAA